MASHTGKAGILVPTNNDGDAMDQLAYAVLDDLLYNIIQDLVTKTHMEEKLARAATAAIRVEKLAIEAADPAAVAVDSRPEVRVENEAAIYEDGRVLLKGNPLKTTTDVLCPRCHLPRLLHPTDGKGARKPDPGTTYCKKQPYIDKPGYDIYGQTWIPQGPGKGKRKKDMEKKQAEETGANVPADQRPANVLSFPSATCSKCKRCILVTRLNNHMGSCIGNSGRNASRAAAQKISNGGSQDPTPPSSQKGTPRPGSRASSPKKRDADQVTGAPGEKAGDGDDDEETTHKKKKLKPSSAGPGTGPSSVKLKIKGPTKPGGLAGPGGLGKKDKVRPSSGLSVEQKLSGTSPLKKGLDSVPPKKPNTKVPSPLKKGGKLVSKALFQSPAKNGRDLDAASESSGTMSSPPR